MSQTSSGWEAIRGFQSPGEHRRFVEFMERQVSSGEAEELEPDPAYGPGELYGGRWFRHRATGEVWRLIPPDPPFYGVWEPVNSAGRSSFT